MSDPVSTRPAHERHPRCLREASHGRELLAVGNCAIGFLLSKVNEPVTAELLQELCDRLLPLMLVAHRRVADAPGAAAGFCGGGAPPRG